MVCNIGRSTLLCYLLCSTKDEREITGELIAKANIKQNHKTHEVVHDIVHGNLVLVKQTQDKR